VRCGGAWCALAQQLGLAIVGLLLLHARCLNHVRLPAPTRLPFAWPCRAPKGRGCGTGRYQAKAIDAAASWFPRARARARLCVDGSGNAQRRAPADEPKQR